ncbi:MAG: hypothetical protein HY052_08290 [Proteobacteria bacterium]|nr:hypothetical protein [Pseudomonadota bacterium]
MVGVLDRAAVGVISGEEAGEILQAFISTGPAMVFNHTLGALSAQKPRGMGAGDQLIEPR